MKKDTLHKVPHPVDAYFQEQEVNIPLGMEDAHWAALQAMLHDSKRPADAPGGHNEPDAVVEKPGSSAFRLFSLLAIVVLLCSTTWVLVADQQGHPEPATSDLFENTGPKALGAGAADELDSSVSGKKSSEAEAETQTTTAPLRLSTPANEALVGEAPVDSAQMNPQFLPGKGLPDSLSTKVPVQEQKEVPAKTKKKKHLAW